MKKTIHKIIDISAVLLVIFNLASYQLFLPINISRAAEEGTNEVITDEPKETGEAEDDSQKAIGENDASATEETNKDENPADETQISSEDPATEETAGDEAISEQAVEDPAVSTPPEETTLTSATATTESASQENCDCENNPPENCDTPCPADCQCCPPPCEEDAISQTNIAVESDNTAMAVSDTGGNTIEGTAAPDGCEESSDNSSESSENGEKNNGEEENDSANALIDSGDAAAQVAAVNTVNTNIYTENGIEIVQNITEDYAEDINLLEAFDNLLASAQNLNEENGQILEHITITNINIAKDVENTAIANADSGSNTIKNIDGDASITTGSSAAVASAVNFINTNIVGDNWLFAVINVVGNWTGNLIVPGEGLLKTPTANLIFDKIVNINIANSIRNFLSAGASTGNNSIESAGGSANIQTGGAVASTSGANFVNTNITSNNWFFLMINNAGNWTGKVINWDGDTGRQSTTYEYEFGSLDGGCGTSACTKSVSVYNYNYAENIENTVIADANAGNNSIVSVGNASITAGNAQAVASAMNFVNTNIVGNNWLFGIVNNAGTWSGNVIFGYPDLAVSLSADKNEVKPGDSVTYTFRYKNIGQAKCADAQMMLSLPEYLIFRSSANSPSDYEGNNYYWQSEGLRPGEEISFSVTAQVDSNIPRGVALLESAAGVRTETTERELSNNYSSSNVSVSFPELANSKVVIVDESALSKEESDLDIERKDDSPSYVNIISNHYIKVKNSGRHTLYNIIVTEKTKDPSGATAAEYSWMIEKLKKGQAAYIQYQIVMDSTAMIGTYRHTARAVGYDEYGNEIKSGKATGLVEFVSGLVSTDSSALSAPEIIPPAQAASEPPSQSVLGAQTNRLNPLWLLALLAIPLAYFIWKRKLYKPLTLQKLARQISHAIFSILP